jgi:hypothetical protein
VKAADITIAVPKAANNATIIAMIVTKVSVIKIHPICAQTPRLNRAVLLKVV